MLADHPYWLVTIQHGDATSRLDTVTYKQHGTCQTYAYTTNIANGGPALLVPKTAAGYQHAFFRVFAKVDKESIAMQ